MEPLGMTKGNYRFMNLYSPYSTGVPYQNIIGLEPLGLPNSHIQWEQTKKSTIRNGVGSFQ